MTIYVKDWLDRDPADIFDYLQSNYVSNNPVLVELFNMQERKELGKGQFMPLMLLCLAEQNEDLSRELRTARLLQLPNSPAIPLKAKIEAWNDVKTFLADSFTDVSGVSTFCDTRTLAVRQTLEQLAKTAKRDERG